jgi:hypothetical protein
MNNYYFTFGYGHNQKDGTPMKDYWVRVVSDSASKAREYFVGVFTTVYMPAPDRFAFQYEEKDFQKHFFPKGEYQVIFTGKTEENSSNIAQNIIDRIK